MMKRYALSLLLLLAPCAARAEVTLYLNAQVRPGSTQLTVGDVSMIGGTAEDRARVAAVAVPVDICRDGFVDRNELIALLRDTIDGPVMIHGSAVRVLGQAAAVRPEQNRGALVYRGDTVDVVMKRGGITIEAIGVALVNARPGQRLSVELKGNKNLRGILREGRVVEVEL